MRRLLFAGLLLAVSATPPLAGDRFSRASSAYNIGFFGAAAHHWRDLAERGHGPAQYNIGRMHYYGQGVPRDPVEAYKWFLLAMEAGVERSHVAARLLGDRLSRQQIVEATLRARDWRARRAR